MLGSIFPQGAAEFDAMADEAGISRLYGGIHYRSDIVEGKAHGKRIGSWVVNFARRRGQLGRQCAGEVEVGRFGVGGGK